MQPAAQVSDAAITDRKQEAFRGLEITGTSEPDDKLALIYDEKYMEWLDILEDQLYELN